LKKLFFAFFLLLVIGSGGYFYFKYFNNNRPEIFQLVPSTAFLAYESPNAGKSWNNLLDKPLWNTLSSFPFFNRAKGEIELLDSISGNDGSLDKLFRNFEFVASLHITSTTSFDAIYYLDLNNKNNQSTFNKILSSVEGNFGYSTSDRSFHDYHILEIKKKGEEKKLSIVKYKDYLIASYTALLIEDVIRNIDQKYANSFATQLDNFKNISKLEDDDGNIYLDFSRLAAAVDIFIDKDKEFPFKDLIRLAENSFLDFKITDNELLLNGTSIVPKGHSGYFLSMYQEQNPGKLDILKILPENTAVFIDQSFQDLETWKKNSSRYWSSTDEKLLDRWLEFQSNYEFSFDFIDGEAGLAIMEAIHVESPDKIIILKVKDSQEAFAKVENLAMKIAEESNDSLFAENFAGKDIVQLPVEEWPELFLGNLFSGFGNSYITPFRDYLLIGNSFEVVKNFINDNENENVWSKNVRQSIFLENTLGEANFSIMVNTDKAWNYILYVLNDEWKRFFNTYEKQIKSMDKLAFQFSNLDENFYTSFALGHKKISKSSRSTSRFKNNLTAFTAKDIVTKPFVMKNHNNGRLEVMVQDAANILYLVSNEGLVLWGDSLESKIVSDIYQIDYYKNNKLQYLFATQKKIHLIDRNGNFVENFPITLKKNVKAAQLSVIDYDNSKNYRFMLADEGGNIYLYDKNKVNLKGWTPRNLTGALAVPGRHIRVRGGDCMIALQKSGILNVMNRRGKMIKGFPFDFKEKILGELYIDIGNNFKTTSLTTITQDGQFTSINLNGDLLNREQLFKPSKECKFWIVNDALEKTFLIVRMEYNNLTFLDAKGDLLFEKNIIGSEELVVQYYYFSTDNQLIIVTDLVQEFTYMFNKNGDLLNLEPLESSYPVSVLYYTNDKTFHIYKCFNNGVSLLTTEE